MPDVAEFRRRLSAAEPGPVSVALGQLLKAASREGGLRAARQLFDDFVTLINGVRCGREFGDHQWADRVVKPAATLMLRADRPRALDVLLEDRRLHPDYPAMPGILEALVAAGEVVPPEKLRRC